MNDIPTPSSHPCQENSSFGAFVSRVESWGLDEFREKRRRPVPRVFRGAVPGHYGGLVRWWGGASRDIQCAFRCKLKKMWELHDMGWSTREIARELGWKSHNSVIVHLRKGRPAPEPEPPWSMASEESPKMALLERLECTSLLQRGRQDEFAAMQEAERAIAKANPAKPRGGPPDRGANVLPEDDCLPASTLRNIRQAHASLSDTDFQIRIEEAREAHGKSAATAPERLAAVAANERNHPEACIWARLS